MVNGVLRPWDRDWIGGILQSTYLPTLDMREGKASRRPSYRIVSNTQEP